jgi:hypothetical protein
VCFSVWISAQLEKFNLLYLGKLEAKIMAIATLMGHIDSNVKHLQVYKSSLERVRD